MFSAHEAQRMDNPSVELHKPAIGLSHSIGERTMNRHSARLFCIALLSIIAWLAADANAQDAMKAAQTHAAAAKALAYEPGQDLTSVYDTLCRPALSAKGPIEPDLQVAPSLADRKVPSRSQWYTEPVKAFD